MKPLVRSCTITKTLELNTFPRLASLRDIVVMLCRHCRCRVANRPRRLCMRCYARPDVRARFPVICRFRRLGVPDYFGASKPASAPTRALPGTREKLMDLAERARRGQALCPAFDARWDD